MPRRQAEFFRKAPRCLPLVSMTMQSTFRRDPLRTNVMLNEVKHLADRRREVSNRSLRAACSHAITHFVRGQYTIQPALGFAAEIEQQRPQR